MHAKAEWILLLGELQEPNVRGVIIVPKHDESDVMFRDNLANRKVSKFCNKISKNNAIHICKNQINLKNVNFFYPLSLGFNIMLFSFKCECDTSNASNRVFKKR